MWIYRYYILIPIAIKDIANQMAKAVSPGHGDADLITFRDLKLSADGQEPATHMACSTAATQQMRDTMVQLITANPGLPFIWYLCDLTNGTLLGSSRSTGVVTNAVANSLPWSWNDCLADMQLQVIQPPAEDPEP